MRAIFQAIERDDPNSLDRLLQERGQEMVDTVWEEKTPLAYAAGLGRDRCVRLLIERGADVDLVTGNTKDGEGNTALLSAVNGEHITCARQLLEAGAEVDPIGCDCDSDCECDNATHCQYQHEPPLVMAAQSGCVEMVRLLLDFNANVDQHGNARYVTALSCAAERGFIDIVKKLIEADCITCCSIWNTTGLVRSVDLEEWEVARVLVSIAFEFNEPDHNGRTPLFATVDKLVVYESEAFPQEMIDEGRHFLDVLLSKGADPNQALLYAIAAEELELPVIRRLVSCGAFPVMYNVADIRNADLYYHECSSPMTPLELARVRESAELMSYFLTIWFLTPHDVNRFDQAALPAALTCSCKNCPKCDVLTTLSDLPWSLEVLSFVQVSSLLSQVNRAERKQQVLRLSLPEVFKKRLLYEDVD